MGVSHDPETKDLLDRLQLGSFKDIQSGCEGLSDDFQ
jgi:hypothetical protein